MNYELHQAHLLLLDMEEDIEMKDIPGWEGEYAATKTGRIWSYKHKKFLSPYISNGYMCVKLCRNSKKKTGRVNILTALAWVPIPEELQGEEQLDVAHGDDNRANNYYTNLYWKTRAQNLDTDSFREKSKVKKFTKIRCIETGEIFASQAAAARWAGIHAYGINSVLFGRQKTAGGYHWERYYDNLS